MNCGLLDELAGTCQPSGRCHPGQPRLELQEQDVVRSKPRVALLRAAEIRRMGALVEARKPSLELQSCGDTAGRLRSPPGASRLVDEIASLALHVPVGPVDGKHQVVVPVPVELLDRRQRLRLELERDEAEPARLPSDLRERSGSRSWWWGG